MNDGLDPYDPLGLNRDFVDHEEELFDEEDPESALSESPEDDEDQYDDQETPPVVTKRLKHMPLLRVSELSSSARKVNIIDFGPSTEALPEAPKIEERRLRTRVKMSEGALIAFEEGAKGTIMGRDELVAFREKIPLPMSVYAVTPVIDDRLRVEKNVRASVTDFALANWQSTCLAAMSSAAFALSELERDPAKAAGYIKSTISLVGCLNMEFLVTRREATLRAMGIDPSRAMPSFRRDRSHGDTTVSRCKEYTPALFGPILLEELTSHSASDDIKKAITNLARNNSGPKRRLVPNDPIQPNSEAPRSTLGRGAEWGRITSDAWVLETIDGYQIPFLRAPPLAHANPDTALGDPVIRDEVMSLLAKGAIRMIPWDSEVFISSIFTVPKKDGSLRPVINLKPLNQYVSHSHFKMERLETVRDLLDRGNFMAKLDLKDAYFAIPIHPESQKYLAFQCEGQLFCFQRLPFGLSESPYVFTRVMKPIAELLRRQGVRMIIYLDDILLIANSEEEMELVTSGILDMFPRLGLTVNLEKSQLTPSKFIEFLGIGIDSHTLHFLVPEGKKQKIASSARTLLQTATPSLRSVAGFVGLSYSVTIASLYARFFLRSLQRWVACHTKTNDPRCYGKKYGLNEYCKHELEWWANRFQTVCGSEEIRDPHTIASIYTDASNEGWGGVLGDSRTGGRWSITERVWHINVKEMKAILFALQSLASHLHSGTIRVESDNMVSVVYLNRRGGSHNCDLNGVSREIWDWARERDLHLVAVHRPGVENMAADYESRHFKESAEWALSQSAADLIFASWGTPSLDLFASRLNHKPPGERDKRLQSRLVGPLRIRFSALPIGRPGDREGHQRGRQDNPDRTQMGRSALVPSAEPLFIPTTHPTYREDGYNPRHSGGRTPDANKEDEIECMDDIKVTFSSLGLSSQSVQAVMNSWSQGTRKQYDSAWGSWIRFAADVQVDRTGPETADIVNYLSHLFTLGRSYATLVVHRAAITTILQIVGVRLDHEILTRAMKGFARLRPSHPKYTVIWDVGMVVQHLADLGPNEGLTLSQLTKKLAMLLALTSPKRVSELARLSLDAVQRSSNKWVFHIDFMNKNRGVGRAHTASFDRFTDPVLCPIETIEHYLSKTQGLRSTRNLLVATIQPHGGVTSTTVARWLKEILSDSGITGYSAHSTRSASTSRGVSAGLSSATIMASTNWAKGGSTFERFYKRDIAQSLQDIVLNSRPQTAPPKTEAAPKPVATRPTQAASVPGTSRIPTRTVGPTPRARMQKPTPAGSQSAPKKKRSD